MMKFGVSGYPQAFRLSKYRKKNIDLLKWVRELGLDAVEMQMTYGPRTPIDRCRDFKSAAADNGVILSIHASYFIVLTSSDAGVIRQSIDTLKKTYELADAMGVKVVVLHPGGLYKGTESDAMKRFIENTDLFLNEVGITDIGLYLETAGKLGQLGSVDHILELSGLLHNVYPCIDFGHVHARTDGSLRDEKSVVALTEKLQKYLDDQKDPKMHFHYTPIEYGPRGEVRHRKITDIDRSSVGDHYYPRPEHVAYALKKINIDCTVISETFDSQEIGAQALSKHYHMPE